MWCDDKLFYMIENAWHFPAGPLILYEYASQFSENSWSTRHFLWSFWHRSQTTAIIEIIDDDGSKIVIQLTANKEWKHVNCVLISSTQQHHVVPVIILCKLLGNLEQNINAWKLGEQFSLESRFYYSRLSVVSLIFIQARLNKILMHQHQVKL